MSLTDITLLIFIILLMSWAIFDQFIMDKIKGKTQLTLPLLRARPVDSAVFVGLVVILLYQNVTSGGTALTTWLLSALLLIAIYIGWFYQPKILFKSQGFFLTNQWINYSRITALNLSEDGVLVAQLEKRRLLIRVKNIDDLEKIYKFMTKIQ